MIEECKTNKTNKEIDQTIMDIIALMSNVKTRHLKGEGRKCLK